MSDLGVELEAPRIPDGAFPAAVGRFVTFLNAAPAGALPDMDAFCRSVGLDGQRDRRQWDVAVAIVASDLDRPVDDLPPERVRACALGMTVGLVLAACAGWEV